MGFAFLYLCAQYKLCCYILCTKNILCLFAIDIIDGLQYFLFDGKKLQNDFSNNVFIDTFSDLSLRNCLYNVQCKTNVRIMHLI